MLTIFTSTTGSIVPVDTPFTLVEGSNLTEKLCEAAQASVPFFTTTTREIQALTEYADVFGLDLIVVDHIPGAKFDSVYDQYAATLAHTTLDTAQALVEKAKATQSAEVVIQDVDNIGDVE